jgi:hypothetical protein
VSLKSQAPSGCDDQGSPTVGTPIGIRSGVDSPEPICIPPEMRSRHVHIIGAPGTGKTTLMTAMILDDIRQGAGVAVIDPHGEIVERVLHLLPERDIERTVHLRPGEPDWVPIWNPLNCGLHASAARIIDTLAGAFKAARLSMGDRPEHLLRHALLAILQLPGGHLQDVANLLRK